MAMIIAGFKALDPTDQTSELDTTVRSIFDKYVKALRSSKPKEFLTLYQDLSAYLPEPDLLLKKTGNHCRQI